MSSGYIVQEHVWLLPILTFQFPGYFRPSPDALVAALALLVIGRAGGRRVLFLVVVEEEKPRLGLLQGFFVQICACLAILFIDRQSGHSCGAIETVSFQSGQVSTEKLQRTRKRRGPPPGIPSWHPFRHDGPKSPDKSCPSLS